jgi:hypothetical protein
MACSNVLTLLADARKAYHDLMVGRSARVVVDGSSGERVEFTAANKNGLYNYIKQLEAQAEAECPGSSGVTVNTSTGLPNNGPMTFLF